MRPGTALPAVASGAVVVSVLVRAMPWLFVAIWSTGFIVARFAMPHAPPMKFLALRFGLSAACFCLWISMARPGWPQGRAQWRHLAVVGLLIQAGYLGGVWTAVKDGIGAGTVALLVGLQPVLTAVFMTLVGGNGNGNGTRNGRSTTDHARVSARQWGGLGCGLAGLVLVVWHKLGGGEINAWNLAMAVTALLSITAGTLYQKRFVAPCDFRTASLVQLSAALAVCLVPAFFESEALAWQPQMVGALAWSVLVLTLGGSSLLYLLIQKGAATEVTSLMYLVPPCTALMAWAFFGEVFSLSMAAGMLLTAVGVALVLQRPARSPASADRPTGTSARPVSKGEPVRWSE